jgi:hypothetical protein
MNKAHKVGKKCLFDGYTMIKFWLFFSKEKDNRLSLCTGAAQIKRLHSWHFVAE